MATPAIENCDYTFDSDASIACYIADGNGAEAFGEEVCKEDVGGVATNLGADGSLQFEQAGGGGTNSHPNFIPNAYCPTPDMLAEEITETSVCSMADTVNISRDTGLIQKGSFKLKWNNLDDTSDWDTSITDQYSKFENNELSGTIALVRDIIAIGSGTEFDFSESYNFYSTLNTGGTQQDPTLTKTFEADMESLAFGGSVDIAYGSEEEDAIKDKYKRYEGREYASGLNNSVSNMVQQIIDSSIKIQTKYNFKKVDTNKAFRNKNVTIFPDEMGATVEETRTTTMTTTTTGGY